MILRCAGSWAARRRRAGWLRQARWGRFETQWLAAPINLSALADLSGQWIDLVQSKTAAWHRARHGFERQSDPRRAGDERLERSLPMGRVPRFPQRRVTLFFWPMRASSANQISIVSQSMPFSRATVSR